MESTAYAFKTRVKLSYHDALQKVIEALKKEGFGVLTEIDLREIMKVKLNAEFRNYKILGACNPKNAHKALQAETDIGLMLPCNVVVYEGDDGHTVVAAVDPVASMMAVKNEGLASVAQEVAAKLKRVIDGMVKDSSSPEP
jgi:uncharacterized protein (DUF302 family)